MASVAVAEPHEEAVTPAYLRIIDGVNKMEISELVAEGEKGEPSR